jgi:hypothetical protein
MPMKILRQWYPELFLTAIAGFFFFRELGTFPAAWTDDSLFMIMAKEIAAGRGYQLPILSTPWFYPYILAIGPPLLLPVASAIQLFGFSVTVARLPMVDYMAGTTLLLYILSWKIHDKTVARWSTALLITLSAFVNTGKVVMGEVPALFYLLLGLVFMLHMQRTWKRNLVVGLCFGLSVLTKLTLGLIYPAIGIAGLVAIWKRDRREIQSLFSMGIVAIAVYLPWRLLEQSHAKGLTKDFEFLFTEDAGFQILHGNLGILLRPQFVYFQIFLILGLIGLWSIRTKAHRTILTLTLTLILMFTAYFLSSFGWYRHLLPAHVLLIPFVVIGTKKLMQPKLMVVLLVFFIAGQSWWQLTYKGSNRSTAGAEAAAYIEKHYKDTPIIIQQTEVYVRLPENPHWLFLTNPILTSRLPAQFVTLSPEQQCMYWFRTVSTEEENALENRFVERIAGKYGLIAPADHCI